MWKSIIAGICALFLSSSIVNALNHPSFPWCGWYARNYIAVTDPGSDYNRAWAWSHWGTGTNIPCPGCVVVWKHHVGMIAGGCHGHICPVRSGNDGHAVRTRMRSIAGAVIRKGPTVLASYPIEEFKQNDEHDARPVHHVHTAHSAQHTIRDDNRHILRVSTHHARVVSGAKQSSPARLDVI